jgi:hypothetical protein
LISALGVALAIVGIAEAVARTALISPHGMLRSQAPTAVLLPDPSNPLVVAMHRWVAPGETFLGLPFMPGIYLNAQRLPFSGDYYYLPPQAEYDRAPILDWDIDLCRDIERVRPPAILLVDIPIAIWGPLSKYKPCFASILASNYVRSSNFSYIDVYVRRDRLP